MCTGLRRTLSRRGLALLTSPVPGATFPHTAAWGAPQALARLPFILPASGASQEWCGSKVVRSHATGEKEGCGSQARLNIRGENPYPRAARGGLGGNNRERGVRRPTVRPRGTMANICPAPYICPPGPAGLARTHAGGPLVQSSVLPPEFAPTLIKRPGYLAG